MGIILFISRLASQMSPDLRNANFILPMLKIMLCRFEAKLRQIYCDRYCCLGVSILMLISQR